MEVNFKLYKDHDYEDLRKMILSLYSEDPEGEPMNEGKINITITEYQKNPQKINIYLIKEDDTNIGYAILVYVWSNEYGGNILTIDELYVAENYRGKGVATEFFAYVERIENIVALQLETTPSNRRTLEYYKRQGFLPSQNVHLIKSMIQTGSCEL